MSHVSVSESLTVLDCLLNYIFYHLFGLFFVACCQGDAVIAKEAAAVAYCIPVAALVIYKGMTRLVA